MENLRSLSIDMTDITGLGRADLEETLPLCMID
jgi:hypothetical protein